MKSRINRDEREISISELWWYVISKWKWLVIGMVVGALLMGAFGAYKAYSANNAKPSKKITMEDLTAEEQEEVKELVEDYKLYKAEAERLKSNYLMGLNYNLVCRSFITYYVDTDYSYNYMDIQENYAVELVSTYKTYILGKEIRDKIMELNIEGLEQLDLNYMISTSSEGNIIKVAVCANEEYCVKIAEVICTAVEGYHNTATEYIGEHTLEKVSMDSSYIYNENIKTGQNIKKSYVSSLSDNVTENKNGLDARQLAVYESMISNNDKGSTTERNNILINKKYIVLGAVIGILATIVIVFVGFVANKKIMTISEIKQVYDIDILGKILRDNTINKYAVKKINKVKTNCIEDEQKKYVADVIRNKCNINNINEVIFCSTVDGLIEEITQIVVLLNERGIRCKYVNDINNDGTALDIVVETKNVICIEQLNKTTKDDFVTEIENCERLEANIFGVVVMI